MSSDLAIVIPVYKKEFLEEALTSIRDQTDSRYHVYIGDDASPDGLASLIEKMDLPDNFHYHRFEKNEGQQSLVKHWMRCVDLIKEEKWIWLFSDDDIADEHCVEEFYKASKQHPGYNVYRFNTKKIDNDGNVLRQNIFPEVTGTPTFLNIKLNYEQESYVVEGIFKKKAFLDIRGFPELPLAWAADDLFWAKLAGESGIYTMSNAWVSWRYSGLNISSRKESKTGRLKLKAAREFIRWIYRQPGLVSKLTSKDLPIKWYIRQLKNLRKEMSQLQQITAVLLVSGHSARVWYYYFQLLKSESRLAEWLKES